MKDIQTFKYTLSTVAAFISYAYPTKRNVSVIASADPHLIEQLGELRAIRVLYDGTVRTRGKLKGLAALCLFEEGYFVPCERRTGATQFLLGSENRLSQHQRLAAIARYSHLHDEVI